MNLHDLITQGHLEKALEILLKKAENTDFYEECAMQSASFHRIERDLEKGLITPQDANLTKNRITHALLSILKRYEKEYGKIEGEIEAEISLKEKPKREDTMVENNAKIDGKNNTVIQNVKNGIIYLGTIIINIGNLGVGIISVVFLIALFMFVFRAEIIKIMDFGKDERKETKTEQPQNNFQSSTGNGEESINEGNPKAEDYEKREIVEKKEPNNETKILVKGTIECRVTGIPLDSVRIDLTGDLGNLKVYSNNEGIFEFITSNKFQTDITNVRLKFTHAKYEKYETDYTLWENHSVKLNSINN